jgi:protein-S-isoprenylcysteine O-methyltransferase Ste14
MRPVRSCAGADAGARRWGIVAFYLVAGTVLHGVFLLAPLLLTGSARFFAATGDPVVWLFLGLATGFYLTDLPTLLHDQKRLISAPSAADRVARRWAQIMGLLLLAAFWAGLLERAHRGAAAPGWPQTMGAGLMASGIAVRAAAILTLGRRFVSEWNPSAGCPLVEDGVYAWVRHPSETGNLAVVVGGALVLESRLVMIWLLALGPITLRRIQGEESLLAHVHGQRFQRYARRVRRLIPGIY